MRILVIDTETGGLDAANHSLLSIGAVVWESGAIVDETEILIREGTIQTDPEAMAVTGFDLDRLKSTGTSPSEAVMRLESFVDRNFGAKQSRPKIVLAGHNVAFDVEFLRRLYRLAGFKFDGLFSHRRVDTAAVLAFLILADRLPESCASSSGAFDHFDIRFAPGERHTALADARATAALLTKLVDSV